MRSFFKRQNGYARRVNASATKLRFRIRALDDAELDRIRTTLVDDFGNRLQVRTGVEAPCRSCLRITRPHEPLIVFALQPFATRGPYAEVGPVFIHAQPCGGYTEVTTFPADFVQRCLTMRAYNDEGTIQAAELSTPGDPEASLARLFADDRVRFVHVRNPAWGCYDFRVDKV